MDHIWISDVRDGQLVDGVYYLRNKNLSTSKAGKLYLTLVLSDRTGELEGKVWDTADKFDAAVAAGEFIFVQARGNSYNNQLQLTVSYLEKVDRADVDAALFLPTTPGDVDKFWQVSVGLLDSIRDPGLLALCRATLADEQIRDGLRRAPAATGIHQPYLGGLLEHTCSLLLLADKICAHYPTLDRDLLLAGVLYHDLGKIREMAYDLALDYTDEGRLIGHQFFSLQYLERLAAGVPELDPQKLMLLQHMILSHHGRPEYGAAKLPMCAEAAVLHHLDLLDARVFGYLEAEAGSAPGRWSERKWFLETAVYKPDRSVPPGYRFALPEEKGGKKEGKKKTKDDLPLFDK